MERRDAEMAEMPRLSVPPHVTWHPTFLHFPIWIVLFATCKATLFVNRNPSGCRYRQYSILKEACYKLSSGL